MCALTGAKSIAGPGDRRYRWSSREILDSDFTSCCIFMIRFWNGEKCLELCRPKGGTKVLKKKKSEAGFGSLPLNCTAAPVAFLLGVVTKHPPKNPPEVYVDFQRFRCADETL